MNFRRVVPALLIAVTAHGAPDPTLLAVSSDPLLVTTIYVSPRRLVTGVAPDGAVGVNAEWETNPSRPWFIEEQRYGADLVQMGLASNDDTVTRQGLRILNWGFAHEGDGSFPGTGDPHHSISFFLEAASRSVLLMREAGDERHLSELRGWKRNIRIAAGHLIQQGVFPRDRGHSMDPYTHRFFLCAAALGEAASALDDPRLRQAALELANAGLQRQWPDGTNPEKGGFDVNYQAVGAIFGLRYLLVCDDPETSNALRNMVEKALVRESAAIDTNGNVDTAGSTRLTMEAARSGKAKSMDYKLLIQALVFWSDISGEPQWRQMAANVARARNW